MRFAPNPEPVFPSLFPLPLLERTRVATLPADLSVTEITSPWLPYGRA